MKALIKLGEVKPLIHKGKLISIDFIYKGSLAVKPVKLYFRDSYQILLANLDKLK